MGGQLVDRQVVQLADQPHRYLLGATVDTEGSARFSAATRVTATRKRASVVPQIGDALESQNLGSQDGPTGAEPRLDIQSEETRSTRRH